MRPRCVTKYQDHESGKHVCQTGRGQREAVDEQWADWVHFVAMKTTTGSLHMCLCFACLLTLGAGLHGQDAPRFNGIERVPDGEVLLQIAASAGSDYRLHATTNLQQWLNVLTFSGAGAQVHIDSAAPYLGRRFYRLQRLAEPALTGDHLSTTNGDVVIHPVNHSTFVMGWNDKTIYIDPVGGPSPFVGMAPADLILVTHHHGDHYSDATIDAVRHAGTEILATQSVYDRMSAVQKTLTTVLTNGARISVSGLTVEAVPAYNLSAAYHPQGVGNGYVLNVADRRIYVSGDTENTSAIRALVAIDLAIVCMNVPYTMDVSQAADAVRSFRPAVVIPCHYRNQNGTFADLHSFKDKVGTDLGIEVRLRNWY